MSKEIIQRRLGKLRISKDLLLNADNKYLKAFFNEMIILQAIPAEMQRYSLTSYIEYTVIHDEFDLIAEGDIIPEYIAEFQRDQNGNVTRSVFRKVI